MFRFGTYGIILVLVVIALIVSCSGGNPVNEAMEGDAVETDSQAGFADLSAEDFADFPAFPVETEADFAAVKDSSWLLNIDPQTPAFENRTYLCGTHADCLILKALYNLPVTHMAAPPYFAYAIYQMPLGASASDLLSLELDGSVVNAGEKYYLAIANYTAMAWQFEGVANANMTVNMAAVGYDFTSAAGNMYVLVAVPRYNTYHLWDIDLVFQDKDPNEDDPTFWNVWGEAYIFIPVGAAPTPMPGETVKFEDLGTGVIYNTVTAANGHWGTNLPTGTFKFSVTNQEQLFDTAAHAVIESLEVILEVNLGNVIYWGPNAAYDGTIIGSPIITTVDY